MQRFFHSVGGDKLVSLTPMHRLFQNFIFLLALILLPVSLVAQDATLKGKVRDSYSHELDSVMVQIKSLKIKTYTDKEGNYYLKVPPGKYFVHFDHPNYKPGVEVVSLGPAANLNVYPKLIERFKIGAVDINDTQKPTDLEDPYNVGSLKIPLDPKLVTRIPGFKSDITSRIASLAVGVSTNSELSSQYRVRGGNFDENLIYVNDIEIYRPFLIRSGQQEGLSFVNPNMASDVGFSSGGFQAKYGDKLSSVLDVTYVNPDDLHGSGELGILNQNFNIEGSIQNARKKEENSSFEDFGDEPEKIAGRFTYLFGVRRFTPSYVLGSLDTKGEYKPRFTDIQGMLTFAPRHSKKLPKIKERKNGDKDTLYFNKERFKISLLFNFADNQYIFTPVSRETSFGTVQNVLRLRVGFEGQDISAYSTTFGALTLEHRPNTKLKIKHIATFFKTVEAELFEVEGGYFLSDVNANFGSEGYNETVFDRGIGTFYRHGRNYLEAMVVAAEQKGDWFPGNNYRHKISWGARFQHQIVDDHIREWNGTDSAGYFIINESYQNNQHVNSSLFKAYFQDHWKISADKTKRLVLGSRVIYNDLNKQLLFAPRVQFVIDPASNDSLRALALDESQYARNDKRRYQIRMATGVYHQPIFYREMRAFDGTLNLNRPAQSSYHAIAGGDYLFNIWGRPFKVTAEGYYKYLTNLVPYEVDNVRIRYYPDQVADGYAYGLDTRVTGEFIKGVDSWMAFGVLKTQEKVQGLGQGYVSRPTDQRFQFSMYFQDELPINPLYKAHINFVYGSGLRFGYPGRLENRTNFAYPSYQRVDLGFSREILINSKAEREDKNFAIETLWVSAEIFNVFQRSNTVSYIWIKDVFNNQFGVPNFLSARLLNLRVIARF